MAIQGKKREEKEFNNVLEIGLFPAQVVAINPNIEEYKEILGIDLKEDSKATEYLGESKDGNTTLRVDFWLKETKRENKFKKVTYFLENKERENKDGSKKQYINNIGTTTWADSEENLGSWFTKRDFRVAYQGEDDFYNFVRTWLGKLDYSDLETVLSLEWKKLMKGNLNDLKEHIGGEFSSVVVGLATVKTVEKDGETKQYQGVWNKMVLPEYALKNFRLVDYHKVEEQEKIKRKDPKKLGAHERFVLAITGEYGCKDEYSFKDIHEYDPSQSIVSTNKVVSEEGADY